MEEENKREANDESKTFVLSHTDVSWTEAGEAMSGTDLQKKIRSLVGESVKLEILPETQVKTWSRDLDILG